MSHLHVAPVLLWFWLPWAAALTFAIVGGGASERVGALILMAAAACSRLIRPSHGVFAAVPPGVLGVDAALFVSLIALAIKAPRRWTLTLATLQGLVLLGHTSKAVDPNLWALGYWLLVIPPQTIGIAVLFWGTLGHRLRVRRTDADQPWRR